MADSIDDKSVNSSLADTNIVYNSNSILTSQHEETDTPLLSDKENGNVCLFGMKGFKAGSTNNAQETKERRQLVLATSLCFVFMFAEIIGGYLAGSLAIMTDAAHLLSDCISFIVALLAICLSRRSPDNYMTFGYKRAEVLGAILSIFGIWLLTTFLFYFALSRLLYEDFEINADTMMIVSGVGIIINIIMAIILHGEGLCCFSALSSSHGHCHSHSHSKHENYDNNNSKGRSEYKPLIDETVQMLDSGKNVIIPVPSAFLTGKSLNDRSNSICSYRSPTHSRANSFSRTIPFGNDLSRRSSSISSLVAVKVKDIANLHRDSVDIDLNRSLIDIKTSIVEEKRHGGCIIDGTICPKHNYIHRDSSENTSDSDDHHHNHHHHHHHNHHNHSHDFSTKNLNIQAAVIHVLGDFIQSIGVFIAAIIIKFYPNAKIADPLCTFVFSIIVMLTTCRIMKDSVNIILEGVPNSISVTRLTEDLTAIEGVRSIHYLNVWSLTVGWNLMAAHILIDPYADSNEVLYAATTIAKNGYNIKHCTFQIEKCTPENVHSHHQHQHNTSITNAKNFIHSNTNEMNDPMINILT